MIDLTGKSVFVRTQEEYSKVLIIAKLQGFRWARGKHLNAIDIPLPNMLNFYDERIVTYSSDERKMYEASEIVACEKKLEEAMAHVKYFANNKDRMSLTDKVIESMLLLANTVESQLEEVKQMERLTLEEAINHEKMMAQRKRWNGKFTKVSLGNEEINKRFEADCIKDAEEHEQFAEWLEELKSYKDIGTLKELKELKENGAFTGLELAKLAIMQKELKKYKDLEEQGLLVRLPCKVGNTVYRVNAGAKQPIIPMTVSKIHFLCYKNERAVRFDAIGKEDMGESCYRLEDIGRIVFLTHEEAEKLDEMKNND